ncbi:MAG TPA: c-type cytochrome [Acidobacteriota bacterium]|nr:c-type cytochrome [Acidobacteriota bacterium]
MNKFKKPYSPMRRRGIKKMPAMTCLLLAVLMAGGFALLTTGLLLEVEAQDINLGTDDQRAAGKVLYDKNCAQCHGAEGDGLGVGADHLKPRPRDFTRGKYKIRTTPTGMLPTHEDLKSVIRRGMPYSSMPPWPNFSDQQLSNLAHYLKTFYRSWDDPAAHETPLDIPSAPSSSEESVERGRGLYVELGCVRCHGEEARGNGPAAREQTDDWGFHLRPADLTKPWTFRGGATYEDVYRTFMTGLNGTPMPAYQSIIPEESDRWALVHYVFSLSDSAEPNYASLARVVPASGEISLERGLEMFQEAPVARFPIVGQIMEPGRMFYPAAVDVEVRAVYDNSDIAILVQWNDIYNEEEGGNDPSVQVPRWDSEAERARILLDPSKFEGGGASAPADDPFADPFAAAPPEDAASEEGGEAEPSEPEEQWSDAIAIQFPKELPAGARKPYFLFGDAQNPVELWYAEMATKEPQLWLGRGSVSLTPDDTGEPFEFTASFEHGRWSAIFKRPRTSRRSISFEQDEFIPVAFSTWDGYNAERGNRRGLSQWFYLYIEPMDQPSPLYPMAQNALAVLAILVVVVFTVRRKFSQQTSQASSQQQEATS